MHINIVIKFVPFICSGDFPLTIVGRAKQSGAPFFVIAPDGTIGWNQATNSWQSTSATGMLLEGTTNTNGNLELHATPTVNGTFYLPDGTEYMKGTANVATILTTTQTLVRNTNFACYFIPD